MPGAITNNFRMFNAKNLKDAYADSDSANMYLFFARVKDWPNEAEPPVPSISNQKVQFDSWNNMIAVKRLTGSDISFAVPRYNWATGTVYTEYDPTNVNLYDSSNPFFVITPERNVYKCLFNNKGAESTVQPTGTSTSTIITSDGYYWKYLYTVTAAEALKFMTDDFIPVKTLEANDSSPQWLVQQTAVNGAVDIIDVDNAGTNYVYKTGTTSSAPTTNTLVLDTNAEGVDNLYTGSTIFITGGLGAGQLREITNYVGVTRTITVSENWTITPDNTSTYSIGPKVTISGDGAGATAYANVTTANTVNYVTMITRGINYANTNITITDSRGADATAKAYISPPDGHGSDPVEELGGWNVAHSILLRGDESLSIPSSNDYRTIGLINNPRISSNNAIATNTTYDLTTQLAIDNVTSNGAYIEDETVTGATSNATGTVVSFTSSNPSNTAGTLRVINKIGTFSSGESLLAAESSVAAVVNTETAGELAKFSGNILYIENQTKIIRASTQTEDIILVVKY